MARGDMVQVLDDLSTGSINNLPSGVVLLRGDVADPVAVARAMEGATGCFHLAAIASVERGTREWLATHRINLSGTVTVLEAAARRGVPVVYASSAAVYGDAGPLPLDESGPVRPLSAYGADKLGCELHARAAGAVHGLRSLGLRFFNVYGPRQDPRSPYSGVISIFCDRLGRGEPVVIYGDGGQTRDFIYVGDVVRALLAGLNGAATEAPVFNVCTGIPVTVRDLAGLIATVCGVALDVHERPERAGEIRHSRGAPGRAWNSLSLPPPMPLRSGLEETINWQLAVRSRLAA